MTLFDRVPISLEFLVTIYHCAVKAPNLNMSMPDALHKVPLSLCPLKCDAKSHLKMFVVVPKLSELGVNGRLTDGISI